MLLIVDGYNLAHALGLAPRKLGPGGLERVRSALLGRLAAELGDSASSTIVVFDAREAPADQPRESTQRGITVCFAAASGDADSHIRALLQQHRGRQMQVVSDDREVQASARAAGAEVSGCRAFIASWAKRPRAMRMRAESEKPAGTSRQDRARWMQAFGDVTPRDE
jgi:hypothetical protein